MEATIQVTIRVRVRVRVRRVSREWRLLFRLQLGLGLGLGLGGYRGNGGYYSGYPNPKLPTLSPQPLKWMRESRPALDAGSCNQHSIDYYHIWKARPALDAGSSIIPVI